MNGRSFSPMLSRRAAPARTPAKTSPASRPAGAGAGMPRFMSAPPKSAPSSAAAAAPLMSRRGDRWETEAQRGAEAVSRSPARSPARTSVLPASRLPVHSVPVAGAFTGRSLQPALRRRLEAELGADLGAVRIHTGPEAAAAAAQAGARAFTQHNHIFLGAGQSPDDVRLIAHEAIHTVQQSAAQNAAWSRGPPKRNSSLSITAAAPGMIQRDASDYVPQILKDAGGLVASGVEAVGDVAAKGFWTLVDELLPANIANLLHEIREAGLWGYLKKKVSSALDSVFARLRAAGGTAAKVGAFFEKLLARGKVIWAALADGCCEPLFQALRDLGTALSEMAGAVWDEITDFLRPVGEWLANVWKKFGAPVVDFLKEYASQQWDQICELGSLLWEQTKKLRDFYAGAWESIKELLGFGQGGDEDGSGGVIGWIKEKAAAVWETIKEEARPVIEPIKKVAETISSLLPISAILELREKINGWVEKATALADNMDEPGDVAENQDLLRDIVIPGIRRALGTLRTQAASASGWVTEKIGGLVTSVTGFFGDLAANALLSPFRGAIGWLETEARALGDWASVKVAGVFTLVDQALVALDRWIDPIFKMLKKLFDVLGNLMDKVGDLILGPLMLVPKCIREPIKDFIVNRILKQIPVFSQLLELPDIWAKVQPAFRQIIVMVFRDGNLFKAAWTFFKTVLSLLGVPPELVTNLIRNAAKAIRDVLKDPVGFLGNVLLAMKQGLLQFLGRIGKHLFDGAVNWLLSGVKGASIKIPDPFTITLRNVLDLVLQVLDLTKEKILQRIEKKKGAEVAKRIRQMIAAGEKVFEWIQVLITEGPAGLWKHVKEDLSNLWTTLLNMVIDFLIGKVVQQATIWVTKTLASGGLSVIIDAVKAVYDAIQVIAQYLKQLLEVANSVLEGVVDIAKGVIGKAADRLESAAAGLLPAVLAFLAKTLGIGDLPVVIGEGIEKVRKTVEDAIDKLIEKTFAAANWVKEKGKQAVDAVLGWLGLKEPIPSDDGESHSIYVDQSSTQLMVASTPKQIDAIMDQIREASAASGAPIKELEEQAKEAKAALAELRKDFGVQNANAGNKTADSENRVRQLTKTLNKAMRVLAAGLGRLLFSDGDKIDDLPKSEINIEPGAKGRAKNVKSMLSANREEGTEPDGSPEGWPQIQEAKLTSSQNLVQLHLINREFGGLGVKGNLVPGTKQNNSNHLQAVETPLKRLIGSKAKSAGKKKPRAVIWYNASVSYYESGTTPFLTKYKKDGLGPSDFADSIKFTWGLFDRKDGTPKPTFTRNTAVLGSFTLAPIPLPGEK